MNDARTHDSIDEHLARALREFASLPGVAEHFIDVPLNSWQLASTVKKMTEGRSALSAAVPTLRDVQDWVEVHWNTERATQPPAGTVSSGDEWGEQGEMQLGAPTAACKLLLAAAGHSAGRVSRYAKEFAAHGLIEVRSFHLLKGLPVSSAKRLDDYCTLLPYGEALQEVKAALAARDMTGEHYWPAESVDDVCALQARSFERRGLRADEFERHVSRLQQCGHETLALILGLVWGTGFRVFGHWYGVADPVAATLPFWHAASSGGMGSQQTALTLPGFRRPSTVRPLNVAELGELVVSFAGLPEETRRVLDLALRRLRDSTERTEVEDKVIDLGIVLEALFSKGGEDIRATVSSRGSWYFSDSHLERKETSALLKKFYDDRSYIVHGNVSKSPARQQRRHENRTALIADVDNVVRASLKSMVSDGQPRDWEDSENSKSIRHDPPRAESDIPSVKSDSLSWSVKEQKEIDEALESVWKPTVDNAPAPPPGASFVSHRGIDREQIERYNQQGIYYIIRVPVLLYMAHPKWLDRASEPLDEHTKYYCQRDVERHLERWQRQAGDKKVYEFELPLEDGIAYLPEHFDYWRKLLAVNREPEEQG